MCMKFEIMFVLKWGKRSDWHTNKMLIEIKIVKDPIFFIKTQAHQCFLDKNATVWLIYSMYLYMCTDWYATGTSLVLWMYCLWTLLRTQQHCDSVPRALHTTFMSEYTKGKDWCDDGNGSLVYYFAHFAGLWYLHFISIYVLKTG